MTAASLLILVPALMAQPMPVPVLDCGVLPSVFQTLRDMHYAKEQVAPRAPGRAVGRFIESLDPSRTLLLKSDVARLKKELPKVFKTMERGNCGVLDEAWRLVIGRSKENEKIVKELLGPKYALDESVTLNFDPEERGYSASAKQRRELIRRMVHFQMSNMLLGETKLSEAKKRIIHRYELATKRLEERLQNRELPGIYAEAYAASLDPHSSFLSARTLADFQISMRLSLEGIGAALTSRDGFTVINSIVPGGQADKQNILRPKDKILAVAQQGEEPISVIDMDLRDVVAMIRGKSGTKVTLTILREGKETKTFDVTITRAKIDVAEQAASIEYETRKIGKRSVKLAVLELPSFYGGDQEGRSSYRDVRALLREASEKKVDGIVLDLSENGGGLLRDAVRISGLFIKTGNVVATKSSRGDLEQLEDDDEAIDYDGPLVVLTSPASASASEILAGALQDYGRAVIVGGEHTFGKGTVQVLTGLPGGVGAIKVTTGMFFLPSGKSTQRVGVASDIRIPTPFESWDIGEAELDYSLPPQSIPPFVSKTANLEGAAGWKPVRRSVVQSLARKSAKRVKESEAFAELVEQIAEAKKNRGEVKLADLRAEAEKDEKKNGDSKPDKAEEADEDNSEYEKMEKAVRGEALSVLADLVAAQ